MTGQHKISRPKRAGTEFEVPQALRNDAEPSNKKARFDVHNPSTLARESDDDEDAILELDEIGKKRNQTKRNAVEVDGYGSDSSNDNFNARADAKARTEKSEKKRQNKSKDEEANDMFADLEEEEFGDEDQDEELTREGKKKQKAVKFMDEGDIVGQVSNSKSGGHVSADFSLNGRQRDREVESSSDEGDDEERDMLEDGMDEELGAGSKKKHAPKLDAFNMKDEEEEGKFDQSGNFVRKATDQFAVHDAWLVGAASKADMKKAKEAHDKREAERRQRNMEEEAISMGETLSILITYVDDGESILEALARLGVSKEKKKPKWQKNKNKNSTELDLDVVPEVDEAEKKRKETVEAITAAADRLLTRGQTDIYEAERALLLRQYRRETGEDWVANTEEAANGSAREWEYRWSDGRDGDEKHGPYDGPTMAAWNEAGYFGEGVEFRQVGTDGWSAVVDFV